MWKTNGKTTTLSLFLDSLFPKTEIPYIIKEVTAKDRQHGKLKTRSLIFIKILVTLGIKCQSVM